VTSEYHFSVEASPGDADLQVVQSGLNDHNRARAGAVRMQPLTALIRDGSNQIVGGAIGWTWGQVLDVRVVWVRDDLRGKGYGRRLMQIVEAEALKRGCHTAVLDSYSFQAPDFYRKLGYEVFGEVDGYAGEHRKYFMKKNLR